MSWMAVRDSCTKWHQFALSSPGTRTLRRIMYALVNPIAATPHAPRKCLPARPAQASGDPEGWRVVCTGHSLGGALATLAAYDLMRRGPPGRWVQGTGEGRP